MTNNSSNTYRTITSCILLCLFNNSYATSEPIIPEKLTTPDCSHKDKHKTIVSYNFKDVELKTVMMLVSNAKQVEVIGMDLLDEKKVSVAADCMNATEFAVSLLLANGFDLSSNEIGQWVIKKM